MKKLTGFVALLSALMTSSALAYVGPGAGISLLGSVFTTLLVILLAAGAILFWPARYIWRRMRGKSKQATMAADAEAKREDD